MKKVLAFSFFLLISSTMVYAKAPKDFKILYKSSAGEIEKGTKEQMEVSQGKVTVNRSAVQIGSSELSQTSRDYKVTPEQLDRLYQIVLDSGFATWPATAEGSHGSQTEESFQITSDGKTVTHQRWEVGNEEKFRTLFKNFNDWFNSIRTAWF